MKMPLLIWLVVILSLWVFSAPGLADQIKFVDWVGIEELDPETNMNAKKIGTFAGDRNSSLWLAASASTPGLIELTLKSDRTIVSDYFSYRIDRVDNLVIRSALKSCNDTCLIDEVEKNGEIIRTMRRGLRINFEYDSSADIVQKPTFSLRGFTRAYNWLLSK